MAKETDTPSTPAAPPALPGTTGPAAFADLKAALPGADATFLCAQLEANATVAQAQSAWMVEQNRRLEAANKTTEAANKATEEARAKAAEAEAKASGKKSGVPPLGGATNAATNEGGDPIARFNELLSAKMTAGMKRQRAVSAVVAENPELHAEYLAAYNAQHKK